MAASRGSAPGPPARIAPRWRARAGVRLVGESSKVPQPRLRRRDGQALATLLATRRQDLAAALGLHPRPEAVGLLTVTVAGTVCALHCGSCLVLGAAGEERGGEPRGWEEASQATFECWTGAAAQNDEAYYQRTTGDASRVP